MVVAVAVVFGIAGDVVAHYSTPIYRGKTVLAPADLDKKSGGSGLSSALGSVSGFAALAGLGLGANDYATEEAIAVLKSESLTEGFIQDKNLLPELFPKAWDSVAKRWKPGKKPPTLGAGFRVVRQGSQSAEGQEDESDHCSNRLEGPSQGGQPDQRTGGTPE